MRILLVGAALLLVVLVVLPAYRARVRRAFAAPGRGPIDAASVTVARVLATRSVTDDEGRVIVAESGHKFASVDVHVAASFLDFDLYDFQLVRERAAAGREENLGNNLSDHYFYWAPLNRALEVIPAVEDREDTSLRLSFQVPDSASRGYLFYWGAYFGPLDIPTPIP